MSLAPHTAPALSDNDVVPVRGLCYPLWQYRIIGEPQRQGKNPC